MTVSYATLSSSTRKCSRLGVRKLLQFAGDLNQ